MGQVNLQKVITGGYPVGWFNYYPELVRVMDSVSGAVFLSYLVERYDLEFHDTEATKEFEIDDEEFRRETGLSREEFKRATHLARALEIIKITRYGVPPITLYQFSGPKFAMQFMRFTTYEPDTSSPPTRSEIGSVRKDVQKRYPRLFIRLGNTHGFYCQECCATADLQIDHKHPVIKGGTNDFDNLQLLCMPCNMRKGARGTEQDT